MKQQVLDQVVLKAISDVLDERLLEEAVDKALEKLRGNQNQQLNHQTAQERELSLIEACQKNLVDAIARGDNMAPLLTRLRNEESRKKDLVSELASLSHPVQVIELDKVRVKKNLQGRVADAKGLLQRHTAQARQILRKLLTKPLNYEVVEEDGTQSFRITGEGSYLGLLNGVTSPFVVSPTGFAGICHDAPQLWGIPFQGMVEAA